MVSNASSRRPERGGPPDLTAAVRRGLAPLRLRRGARIVIGVSGGADSVALACGLAEIAAAEGWRVYVAHLHHGLRGAAADADLAFVRVLARSLGARFASARADVRAAARRRGISIEMAARLARRRFLARLARRERAAAVALAHTADDQAETVLLRLARGAAARGLGGMAAVSDLNGVPLVRPLLEVSRREIEAWLRARGQPWREDASNRDPAFLRNRVRWRVLPLLERELNPRVRDALCRAARALREDERLLAQLADRWRRRAAAADGGLRANVLRRAPAPLRRRALREWICDCARLDDELDEAMIGRAESVAIGTARAAELARGWRIAVTKGVLRLRRGGGRAPRPEPIRQPVPGGVELPWAGAAAEATFARGYRRVRPPGVGRLPDTAWLAREKALNADLRWRTWRPGDRIQPLGMTGSRKLQDIFTEAGLPAEERRRWPVLVCDSEVVWVPGYRIAGAWAAASAATPTVRLRVRRLRARN